ncbi:4-hydroxythreonine-4-phosphate dehydrogenase PdxA [Paenibacillus alkalitolerans]|uniref:4-hydroxythreonine-4-phosphate dehydrogenase PdxA n=1 Tax=Paenibacillus alkalitolerans TaxID=2799335 RepID=UPI0018F29A62|nr:4-hydroxythreonine-4-phosphate dehydrogenase PdxA [Paenibacillus alkalitolerans]
MNQTKPIVGITMGDAAGVGPEIIAKAFARPDIHSICSPVVIGDYASIIRAAKATSVDIAIRPVEEVEECKWKDDGGEALHVIDMKAVPADLPYGRISAEAGRAAYLFVEKAVKLALERRIDAICTAPLNKEALHMGGYRFPGHTEILARLTGTEQYAMLLAAPRLRVIHVTTHIGIIDAIERINPERVLRVIRMSHQFLQRTGIPAPSIAVCGINPHAGEGGLFGRGEEETKIIPAVKQAVEEGIRVYGPLPADTLFYRAVRGDFDIVVAMYHDQGHGPVKVLGLEAGVNITVGLPVVRTSVDHGTAFDIAGRGIADESSMVEAIRQAALLSPQHGTIGL